MVADGCAASTQSTQGCAVPWLDSVTEGVEGWTPPLLSLRLCGLSLRAGLGPQDLQNSIPALEICSFSCLRPEESH